MEREQGPFWAWPGRRNLIYAYLMLGPLLTLWFVGIYAGSDYLTGLHDFRVPCYFAFELAIPFMPATVVLYHSLHPAYAVAPFILRTRSEMNALAAVWMVITIVSGVVFLTLPFEPGYPEPSDASLGGWRTLYRIADAANLRFNCMPSLHVAFGFASMDVYARKAKPLGKRLLWLWGVGLMASTVLLHQHHLADVIAGFALAMFGSRVIYPYCLERF